ncbi:hypothetical protein FACS1894132_13920 [Clostridia bacterium]|nr:hypothetical protein FACS1894132_13920 [Clostridia bacterium]
MNVGEVFRVLYPYCGGEQKVSEFVVTLTDNFMEEPANDEDIKKAANGDYNPLENLQEPTLKQYYSGSRSFPVKHANVLLKHMDKAKFDDFISQSSVDALASLCDELKKFGIQATAQDVGMVCADLLERALRSCVSGTLVDAQRNANEEYSAEIAAFASVQSPITSVYVADGKLHIGGDTIKLSPRLCPPDTIAEQESGYIPKLFEAYSDAEQPTTVTAETLSAFPKYAHNFSEQRRHYFNAVYVIETVRGKLGNEWAEQLDILKEETFEGIKEVYYDERHEHGFERLLEVLHEVGHTDVSKSLLCQIKNLIGLSERKGVCHILVCDGTIKSWVDIYA